ATPSVSPRKGAHDKISSTKEPSKPFRRCIAGLTDISSGELLVHDKPVAGPPDGVAMVFQHFGLLPWKTVYDNAAFGNLPQPVVGFSGTAYYR
ncbi:hypothetical protein B4Q13_22700, partial [Lacticaseibacillus rhamnosus]